jgi:hypothetical protein
MGRQDCDYFEIDDRDEHALDKSLAALAALLRRRGTVPPIMTSTDSSMLAHAWVAERLGTAGAGACMAATSVATHKYLARTLIEGCDGIRFGKVLNTDARLPAMEGVEQAIVKPVTSVGSTGVQVV